MGRFPVSTPFDHPREACGVFGVYAPGEDVARLTYFGLFALQHRGQESAGIAVGDGTEIVVYKELGLVAQVFNNERIFYGLKGHVATGHVRYSTTGSSGRWDNAQPIFKTRADGGGLALGHNGNLVNTIALARSLSDETNPGDARVESSSDTDLIATMLAREPSGDLLEGFRRAVPQLEGAYSLVAQDEKRLFGVRDPHGVRPLVLGKLREDGWVLASETCALDIIGADYIRDVEPGELIVIDAAGPHSEHLMPAQPRLCVFEYVYFARPDSVLNGRSVYEVRRAMGKQLADEAPADGELVIPVPACAVASAQGYADRAGLPYADGIVQNRYVGRTFIQPTQSLRGQGVRMKLNPLPEVIEGKRLVVIDDSIVRGTTTREIVDMLRRAGAREVHMRISSPPIRWPCFYGIDTANRDELIAADKDVDVIRDFIGADSLGYLSLDGMLTSTGAPTEKLCHACFSGGYPIPIPPETALTKHVLETPVGAPTRR